MKDNNPVDPKNLLELGAALEQQDSDRHHTGTSHGCKPRPSVVCSTFDVMKMSSRMTERRRTRNHQNQLDFKVTFNEEDPSPDICTGSQGLFGGSKLEVDFWIDQYGCVFRLIL